jgi:glyoxylase-like metal-dependent hydrolase (beta-lactamase superfamily II)
MKIATLPIGPLQTNCYVIACPDTAMAAVIDPAWSGETIYGYIEQEELSLELILLTHAHFDHIAGAAALHRLSGARLLAHPDSHPLLEQAPLHAQAWGFQIDPPPVPDGELTDGQMIQVGELNLEVLYTPGHAPGHVSFYDAEAGIVFDGDLLFSGSIGRSDLPGGDHQRLLRSIREKLLTLPDDTSVYSGHGPVTTIERERRWNPFLR